MATPTPPLISQSAGLHNPPAWLRQRVVGYVARVEAQPVDPLPFRDNPQPGAPADIETTVWALSALRQVGAEDVIDRARPRALAALQAAFNPDLGIYEPTSTQIGGGPGAWRMHFDAVVRIGFELLDEQPASLPKRPPSPVRLPLGARRPGRLDVPGWMPGLGRGPTRRRQGRVSVPLVLHSPRPAANHVDDLDDQAQQVLAYLESRRDPATGFIGMGPERGTRLGHARPPQPGPQPALAPGRVRAGHRAHDRRHPRLPAARRPVPRRRHVRQHGRRPPAGRIRTPRPRTAAPSPSSPPAAA